MEIRITDGAGEGPTELAAFDKALFDAGIANYNLIKLSSVIPPKSKVKVGKVYLNDKAHGDKLYVVLSEKRESRAGKEAWAGLGWAIAAKGGGKGIFVEHQGCNKKDVKAKITKSLDSMVRYRKGTYEPAQMKLIGAKCERGPVCALVAAVYKSEGWG